MVVMIVASAVYGLAQCAALGSWVRSVRWRTLLLAVFAGAYAAAVISVALQWAWTRSFAAVSGVPLSSVVTVAGYTLDPVIEELVKILPVLVVWRLVAAVRRSWGYTDLVLVAAGVGTGFGITEDLLRFGGAAHRVVSSGPLGDWTVPGGIFGAYQVPSPATAAGQWIPSGVQVDSYLSSAPTDAIDVHLVWSAIAGLGLALLLRPSPGRARARWVGVALIGFAAADHVANNTIGAGGIAQALGTPLGWLRHLIWAYPLAVLAAAAVLDRRVLERGRRLDPSVVLPGDGSPAAVLARLALARPRVSLPVVWSFVRLRRAYWTSLAVAPGGSGHPAARPPARSPGEVARAVQQLCAVLRSAAGPDGERVWGLLEADRAQARRQARGERSRLAIVVWAALLAGPFLYFVVGGVPQWSGVQTWLSASPGFWIMVGLAVLAMAWTGWRLRAVVLAWPRVRGLPAADPPAGLILGATAQVASVGIGAVVVYRALRGGSGTDSIVSNYHVLDAINEVLLVGGLALMLLAIAADPPLALVVLAEGGTLLELTGISAATLAQLTVGAAAAGTGIRYMNAPDGGGGGDPAGSAGEGSSDSVGRYYVNDRGGFSFSDHALSQIEERNIPGSWVRDALDSGEEFEYLDLRSGDPRIGYYDGGTKTFVASTTDGDVTTVIDNVDRSYIDSIKSRTP